MNIDSTGPLTPGHVPASAPRPAPAAAPRAPGAAAPQVAKASGVTHLVSTHGDFDAQKVAEIRASISEGRYTVNTGRIADGLLDSVCELLQRPRP